MPPPRRRDGRRNCRDAARVGHGFWQRVGRNHGLGGKSGGSGGGSGDGPEGTGGKSAPPPECADVSCQDNATCVLEEGTPICQCAPGFEEVGDGCEDVDECDADPCGDHELCENQLGSFGCSCAPGFYEDLDQCWPDMVLVSAASENQGMQTAIVSARISADGHHVAFDVANANTWFPGAAASEVLLWGRGTELALARPSGVTPNAEVWGRTSLSSDGSVVAFASLATNLLQGDTNDVADVFVISGEMLRRVSVSSSGTQANGHSEWTSLSANGRRVAFSSMASNLVSGETDTSSEIYVRDLDSGTTVRASVSTDFDPSPDCYSPYISSDGGFVVFQCYGSLSASDTSLASWDVYLWDSATQSVELISESPVSGLAVGAERGSVSGDGRFVVFSSTATDLVPGEDAGGVFVLDRSTGQFELVSGSLGGNTGYGTRAISDDGRYVVFGAADTNGLRQVFLRDRVAGTTTTVSTGPDGQVGDGHSESEEISADGRFLVFRSRATNFGANTDEALEEVWLKRILP